ncbi:MAG: alcohol dehydrogenase AdhP [Hydrococcus sp. Prado102]|jgi:propanol-preferring alcohol dehydrogenase|nr:alcohol dehydrogenase AdhP [Hydrococcus sp. Prado102]
MTDFMKAAVAIEFGKPLSIEEIPVPEPATGQVLIKVIASGVCHTDVHAADGDWLIKPKLPLIPGHEVAGYVAKVGAGVSSLKKGDRVGVSWLHSACGCCEHCFTGWETLCTNQQNTGYSVNGGFAEYMLAQADYVARLPDGLSFEEAAPILCAGVTTYKGLKETDTKPGDWVVISGIGGLGHIAVQYAKAMGLRVVALARSEEKLQLARKLGADITLNVREEDPAILQERIGGAHGALVTAVSIEAFQQAVSVLRRRGTCSLVGIPPGTFPLSIFDVVLKRLTVRGSIVGTRQDMQEALEFVAQGKVKPLIEKQSLNNINEIFDRLRKNQVNGRIVLNIAQSNN